MLTCLALFTSRALQVHLSTSWRTPDSRDDGMQRLRLVSQARRFTALRTLSVHPGLQCRCHHDSLIGHRTQA
jgi:hypothetical protein